MTIFDKWEEFLFENIDTCVGSCIGSCIDEVKDDAFDDLFIKFKESLSERMILLISNGGRYDDIWGIFYKVWDEMAE